MRQRITYLILALSGLLILNPATAYCSESADKHSLLFILPLAYLGGMILNLMPCVLPVLMVKVFSFTRLVHESSHSKTPHALSYTAGILSAMTALALLVIGLKSAGKAVGWGFQFHNPVFVALTAAVCAAFAMSLFDVFTIGVQADSINKKADESSELKRSFFEGILAVILSTPCSAPFLATAIGFALTGSSFSILAVFVTIGLGLATPFALLVLLPGAHRLVPKPGEWMNTFKKALGFTLMATAIWLVWVVGKQSGVDGMARAMVFLLVICMGAWIFGIGQYMSGKKRYLLLIINLLMLGAAGFMTLDFEKQDRKIEAGDINWRSFNHGEIAKELKSGRIVFADFTADWCVTCKANEKTVIDSDRIKKEIKKHKVAMFKADYTNGDDWITKELQKYGKSAVPMYLIWSPKRPDKPVVLSEILTIDSLSKAILAQTK